MALAKFILSWANSFIPFPEVGVWIWPRVKYQPTGLCLCGRFVHVVSEKKQANIWNSAKSAAQPKKTRPLPPMNLICYRSLSDEHIFIYNIYVYSFYKTNTMRHVILENVRLFTGRKRKQGKPISGITEMSPSKHIRWYVDLKKYTEFKKIKELDQVRSYSLAN